MAKTRKIIINWREHIIAQDDDMDYSEAGWVAVYYEGTAYLAKYSHCSCYGTSECLFSSGSSDEIEECKLQEGKWAIWSGSKSQLIRMAKGKKDPSLPDRAANPEDYDYDHLISVYDQVLRWARNHRGE